MILGVVLGLGAVAIGALAGGLAGNRVPLWAEPGPMARLAVYLTRNVARTAADAAFPELRPRRFGLSAPRLAELAARAAIGLGWEVRLEGETVHAVIATPVLRFRDDLTATARAEAEGAVLDVESRSRVGRADLGANLRHVIDLHAALDDLAAARAEPGS